MIGNGTNKKSLAYVDNVVHFITCCLTSSKRFAIYNYVDDPEWDMNSLVSFVNKRLYNKNEVGLRIPYLMGLMAGYVADFVAKVFGVKFGISSVRIKKFCSISSFSSKKNEVEGFDAPFSLAEGIDRTLESEFINPNAQREVFFTE